MLKTVKPTDSKEIQALVTALRNTYETKLMGVVAAALAYPWHVLSFRFVVKVGDDDYDSVYKFDGLGDMHTCVVSDGTNCVSRVWTYSNSSSPTSDVVLDMARELREMADSDAKRKEV